MTPANNLPQRDSPPDPLVGLRTLAPQQSMAEPNAEQQAEGILDGFRQMMAFTATTATNVPTLAEKMRNIRQLAMEAMMQVQSMAEQGGPEGTY